MPTEEELEQRINEHIDRERVRDAVLAIELEQMNRALEKGKAVQKK